MSSNLTVYPDWLNWGAQRQLIACPTTEQCSDAVKDLIRAILSGDTEQPEEDEKKGHKPAVYEFLLVDSVDALNNFSCSSVELWSPHNNKPQGSSLASSSSVCSVSTITNLMDGTLHARPTASPLERLCFEGCHQETKLSSTSSNVSSQRQVDKNTTRKRETASGQQNQSVTTVGKKSKKRVYLILLCDYLTARSLEGLNSLLDLNENRYEGRKISRNLYVLAFLSYQLTISKNTLATPFYERFGSVAWMEPPGMMDHHHINPSSSSSFHQGERFSYTWQEGANGAELGSNFHLPKITKTVQHNISTASSRKNQANTETDTGGGDGGIIHVISFEGAAFDLQEQISPTDQQLWEDSHGGPLSVVFHDVSLEQHWYDGVFGRLTLSSKRDGTIKLIPGAYLQMLQSMEQRPDATIILILLDAPYSSKIAVQKALAEQELNLFSLYIAPTMNLQKEKEKEVMTNPDLHVWCLVSGPTLLLGKWKIEVPPLVPLALSEQPQEGGDTLPSLHTTKRIRIRHWNADTSIFQGQEGKNLLPCASLNFAVFDDYLHHVSIVDAQNGTISMSQKLALDEYASVCITSQLEEKQWLKLVRYISDCHRLHHDANEGGKTEKRPAKKPNVLNVIFVAPNVNIPSQLRNFVESQLLTATSAMNSVKTGGSGFAKAQTMSTPQLLRCISDMLCFERNEGGMRSFSPSATLSFDEDTAEHHSASKKDKKDSNEPVSIVDQGLRSLFANLNVLPQYHGSFVEDMNSCGMMVIASPTPVELADYIVRMLSYIYAPISTGRREQQRITTTTKKKGGMALFPSSSVGKHVELESEKMMTRWPSEGEEIGATSDPLESMAYAGVECEVFHVTNTSRPDDLLHEILVKSIQEGKAEGNESHVGQRRYRFMLSSFLQQLFPKTFPADDAPGKKSSLGGAKVCLLTGLESNSVLQRLLETLLRPFDKYVVINGKRVSLRKRGLEDGMGVESSIEEEKGLADVYLIIIFCQSTEKKLETRIIESVIPDVFHEPLNSMDSVLLLTHNTLSSFVPLQSSESSPATSLLSPTEGAFSPTKMYNYSDDNTSFLLPYKHVFMTVLQALLRVWLDNVENSCNHQPLEFRVLQSDISAMLLLCNQAVFNEKNSSRNRRVAAEICPGDSKDVAEERLLQSLMMTAVHTVFSKMPTETEVWHLAASLRHHLYTMQAYQKLQATTGVSTTQSGGSSMALDIDSEKSCSASSASAALLGSNVSTPSPKRLQGEKTQSGQSSSKESTSLMEKSPTGLKPSFRDALLSAGATTTAMSGNHNANEVKAVPTKAPPVTNNIKSDPSSLSSSRQPIVPNNSNNVTSTVSSSGCLSLPLQHPTMLDAALKMIQFISVHLISNLNPAAIWHTIVKMSRKDFVKYVGQPLVDSFLAKAGQYLSEQQEFNESPVRPTAQKNTTSNSSGKKQKSTSSSSQSKEKEGDGDSGGEVAPLSPLMPKGSRGTMSATPQPPPTSTPAAGLLAPTAAHMLAFTDVCSFVIHYFLAQLELCQMILEAASSVPMTSAALNSTSSSTHSTSRPTLTALSELRSLLQWRLDQNALTPTLPQEQHGRAFPALGSLMLGNFFVILSLEDYNSSEAMKESFLTPGASGSVKTPSHKSASISSPTSTTQQGGENAEEIAHQLQSIGLVTCLATNFISGQLNEALAHAFHIFTDLVLPASSPIAEDSSPSGQKKGKQNSKKQRASLATKDTKRWNVFHFVFHEASTAHDLIGTEEVINGESQFVPGPLALWVWEATSEKNEGVSILRLANVDRDKSNVLFVLRPIFWGLPIRINGKLYSVNVRRHPILFLYSLTTATTPHLCQPRLNERTVSTLLTRYTTFARIAPTAIEDTVAGDYFFTVLHPISAHINVKGNRREQRRALPSGHGHRIDKEEDRMNEAMELSTYLVRRCQSVHRMMCLYEQSKSTLEVSTGTSSSSWIVPTPANSDFYQLLLTLKASLSAFQKHISPSTRSPSNLSIGLPSFETLLCECCLVVYGGQWNAAERMTMEKFIIDQQFHFVDEEQHHLQGGRRQMITLMPQVLKEGNCPICLISVTEEAALTSSGGKTWIRLVCGHTMHYECVLQWWASLHSGQDSCPVCKSASADISFSEVYAFQILHQRTLDLVSKFQPVQSGAINTPQLVLTESTLALMDVVQTLLNVAEIPREDREKFPVVGGKVGLLVEGPSGRGKDFLVDTLLQSNHYIPIEPKLAYEANESTDESTDQQQKTANSFKKQFLHINAALNSTTEVRQALIYSIQHGCVLVVSELNILPSSFTDSMLGELPDLLQEYPINAHRFLFFATVNPPETTTGRFILSRLMAESFVVLSIKNYLSWELLEIVKSTGMPNSTPVTSVTLQEKACHLIHDVHVALAQKMSARRLHPEPTLRKLSQCTRFALANLLPSSGDLKQLSRQVHNYLNVQYALQLRLLDITAVTDILSSQDTGLGEGNDEEVSATAATTTEQFSAEVICHLTGDGQSLIPFYTRHGSLKSDENDVPKENGITALLHRVSCSALIALPKRNNVSVARGRGMPSVYHSSIAALCDDLRSLIALCKLQPTIWAFFQQKQYIYQQFEKLVKTVLSHFVFHQAELSGLKGISDVPALSIVFSNITNLLHLQPSSVSTGTSSILTRNLAELLLSVAKVLTADSLRQPTAVSEAIFCLQLQFKEFKEGVRAKVADTNLLNRVTTVQHQKEEAANDLDLADDLLPAYVTIFLDIAEIFAPQQTSQRLSPFFQGKEEYNRCSIPIRWTEDDLLDSQLLVLPQLNNISQMFFAEVIQILWDLRVNTATAFFENEIARRKRIETNFLKSKSNSYNPIGEGGEIDQRLGNLIQNLNITGAAEGSWNTLSANSEESQGLDDHSINEAFAQTEEQKSAEPLNVFESLPEPAPDGLARLIVNDSGNTGAGKEREGTTSNYQGSWFSVYDTRPSTVQISVEAVMPPSGLFPLVVEDRVLAMVDPYSLNISPDYEALQGWCFELDTTLYALARHLQEHLNWVPEIGFNIATFDRKILNHPRHALTLPVPSGWSLQDPDNIKMVIPSCGLEVKLPTTPDASICSQAIVLVPNNAWLAAQIASAKEVMRSDSMESFPSGSMMEPESNHLADAVVCYRVTPPPGFMDANFLARQRLRKRLSVHHEYSRFYNQLASRFEAWETTFLRDLDMLVGHLRLSVEGQHLLRPIQHFSVTTFEGLSWIARTKGISALGQILEFVQAISSTRLDPTKFPGAFHATSNTPSYVRGRIGMLLSHYATQDTFSCGNPFRLPQSALPVFLTTLLRAMFSTAVPVLLVDGYVANASTGLTYAARWIKLFVNGTWHRLDINHWYSDRSNPFHIRAFQELWFDTIPPHITGYPDVCQRFAPFDGSVVRRWRQFEQRNAEISNIIQAQLDASFFTTSCGFSKVYNCSSGRIVPQRLVNGLADFFEMTVLSEDEQSQRNLRLIVFTGFPKIAKATLSATVISGNTSFHRSVPMPSSFFSSTSSYSPPLCGTLLHVEWIHQLIALGFDIQVWDPSSTTTSSTGNVSGTPASPASNTQSSPATAGRGQRFRRHRIQSPVQLFQIIDEWDLWDNNECIGLNAYESSTCVVLNSAWAAALLIRFSEMVRMYCRGQFPVASIVDKAQVTRHVLQSSLSDTTKAELRSVVERIRSRFQQRRNVQFDQILRYVALEIGPNVHGVRGEMMELVDANEHPWQRSGSRSGGSSQSSNSMWPPQARGAGQQGNIHMVNQGDQNGSMCLPLEQQFMDPVTGSTLHNVIDASVDYHLVGLGDQALIMLELQLQQRLEAYHSKKAGGRKNIQAEGSEEGGKGENTFAEEKGRQNPAASILPTRLTIVHSHEHYRTPHNRTHWMMVMHPQNLGQPSILQSLAVRNLKELNLFCCSVTIDAIFYPSAMTQHLPLIEEFSAIRCNFQPRPTSGGEREVSSASVSTTTDPIAQQPFGTAGVSQKFFVDFSRWKHLRHLRLRGNFFPRETSLDFARCFELQSLEIGPGMYASSTTAPHTIQRPSARGFSSKVSSDVASSHPVPHHIPGTVNFLDLTRLVNLRRLTFSDLEYGAAKEWINLPVLKEISLPNHYIFHPQFIPTIASSSEIYNNKKEPNSKNNEGEAPEDKEMWASIRTQENLEAGIHWSIYEQIAQLLIALYDAYRQWASSTSHVSYDPYHPDSKGAASSSHSEHAPQSSISNVTLEQIRALMPKIVVPTVEAEQKLRCICEDLGSFVDVRVVEMGQHRGGKQGIINNVSATTTTSTTPANIKSPNTAGSPNTGIHEGIRPTPSSMMTTAPIIGDEIELSNALQHSLEILGISFHSCTFSLLLPQLMEVVHAVTSHLSEDSPLTIKISNSLVSRFRDSLNHLLEGEVKSASTMVRQCLALCSVLSRLPQLTPLMKVARNDSIYLTLMDTHELSKSFFLQAEKEHRLPKIWDDTRADYVLQRLEWYIYLQEKNCVPSYPQQKPLQRDEVNNLRYFLQS